MRIVAGQWRGRKLSAPAGETTRPTADRTRETLFSMLTSRLGSFEGLAVADLFAGSGALGLEALSRGAASCIFVEQDAPAVRVLRQNVANLGAQGQSDVRATSVLSRRLDFRRVNCGGYSSPIRRFSVWLGRRRARVSVSRFLGCSPRSV